MTADLVPRASGFLARLLVSLPAVTASTTAGPPSPVHAIPVDGVDHSVFIDKTAVYPLPSYSGRGA
jgi:hypothetical protein